MERFILALFLLIFGFGTAQDVEADAVQNQYEHIYNFHSDITIDKDAQVTVTEKIKIYASGNIFKRGIVRSLPRKRNINGSTKKIKYDIQSVVRDGAEENYHTEKTSDDLTIYVGNKDVILPPGVYSYEITYKTSDQISFYKEYDEFYWNVNGTLWNLAVDQISAKVTLPANAEIYQRSCYTGSYGSNASNCTSSEINTHTIEFAAKQLNPNEGLTVAVGFAKGVFTPPPPPGPLEKYGIFGLLFLAAIGLLGWFYSQWQKYGVDPQKPVPYPQFNAPQNLSPASIGYIEKEYYTGSLVSAAIVSLATKGFVKIIEDDKRVLGIFGGREYTLEKIKEQDQSLSKEEINLMNNLFFGSAKKVTFDGKYNPDIKKAVDDFQAALQFQHDKFLKEGNNSTKLFLPILIILALYAAGLYASTTITENDKLLGVGIVLGIAIFVGAIVFSLSYERYIFMKILFWISSTVLVLMLAFVIWGDQYRIENLGFYSSFGFIILGYISLVLFQYLIKQPTPEKLETLSLIEGFKMYLGTAEEKTLQFHNSPKMTPEVFEKMLPFAMVLGVDKIWGEKFQNMLKNSSLGQENYQSNWFVGASLMNMNFASSLNSSLSQSIASSSTQPSSSGSGSSGGGFSGGGGGGGGGGGW